MSIKEVQIKSSISDIKDPQYELKVKQSGPKYLPPHGQGCNRVTSSQVGGRQYFPCKFLILIWNAAISPGH